MMHNHTYVYHEKQESSLCGQHALNALLIGHYFSPGDLAEIAHQLDAQERELMLAAGADTDDAIKFLAEDSGNVNAAGFFSVDVLRLALERFGDIQLINSTAQGAQEQGDITQEQGFIVNRAEHWFTLRRIGQRWFNLNSTLAKPEEIRPFYLSAFLAQLQADGYSVFIVRGTGLPVQGFPDEADLISGGVGRWYPVSDLVGGASSSSSQGTTQQGKEEEDGTKKKGEEGGKGSSYWSRFGIGQFLGGGGQTGEGEKGGDKGTTPPPPPPSPPPTADLSEDEELARAIALSLEK